MTIRHHRWRNTALAAAIAGITVFMIFIFIFASWALAGVAANAAEAQPAAGTRSVRDGVYTEEQAKRGQAQYRRCLLCHLDELQGDPARQIAPIAGDAFLEKWSSHPVKELFEKTSTTMPQDSPGSLSPQEYADVLAYVFQVNKLPAGKEELSAQKDQLDRILIEKPRPDAKN
jgi:cytochrome c553